jgi:tetratricopeptide (TPR) repeat protein
VTTRKGLRAKGKEQRTRRWRSVLCPLSFVLWAAAGCSWDQLNPFHKDDPPPVVKQDSVIVGPNGLTRAMPSPVDTNPDLIAAKEVARQGEYAKAEKLFHKIAEKVKDEPLIAGDARFHEAECLRMQGHYPKAADTYIRLLNDFGSDIHREEAVKQLFEIANYWLEDTRNEMEEYKEKTAGKRWMVMPTVFHLDKSKPFFDEEGRALEALEHVRYNDMHGPYADKALFMIGTVKFFNEDYREADYQFTQIVENHKASPLWPRAAEMAIISKNLSTGGSDYDGRKCAEARDMVPIALVGYQQMERQDPKLSQEKQEFLRRQLAGITLQQAEKDYKRAEFYLRTKRPESAFFLFEIVRRRYPGTRYADMATEQMYKIRDKVEKDGGNKLPIPEAAPLRPDVSTTYRQLPGAPQASPEPQQQPAGQAPNAFTQPQPLPPGLQQ